MRPRSLALSGFPLATEVLSHSPSWASCLLTLLPGGVLGPCLLQPWLDRRDPFSEQELWRPWDLGELPSNIRVLREIMRPCLWSSGSDGEMHPVIQEQPSERRHSLAVRGA